MALRVCMGTWGSDDGWCGSVGPVWSSGSEEDAEPVVLEVPESSAAAFDFFDHQVQALGRAVRGAVSMWARISVRHLAKVRPRRAGRGLWRTR